MMKEKGKKKRGLYIEGVFGEGGVYLTIAIIASFVI